METKDWITPLPDAVRWNDITWVRDPPRPPALIATTEAGTERFEPAPLAWYEEVQAALNRRQDSSPLVRAVLPTVSCADRSEAVRAVEACAANDEPNRDVFSAAARLVCAAAPEQRPIRPELIGAACFSLASRLQFDTTRGEAVNAILAAGVLEEDDIALDEAVTTVRNTVGRFGALRIVITERHTPDFPLPLRQSRAGAQRKV